MAKHTPMRWNPFSDRTEAGVAYIDEFEVSERAPSPLAVIYRSEFDYISRCILDYPNIETGGQLFGFWTGSGVPVVLYAIGPGRNANHQPAFFNQDVPYLTKVGNTLLQRYELQHIGEWHSHHRLGLARPSGHDASTMIGSIRHLGLRRFLLCIGNCDYSSSTLNAFNFHESDLNNYVQAAWIIKEMESPYRRVIDSELRDIIEHPYTKKASHGANYTAVPRPAKSTPAYGSGYWLTDKSNNRQLKEIIDFLVAETGAMPSVQVDDNGHVHISGPTCNGKMSVYFPSRFPEEAPYITLEHPGPYTADDMWPQDGSIAERFAICYLRLVGKYPPPPEFAVEPEGEREKEAVGVATVRRLLGI